MDFLNRAFTQIADLFKSLSPGARLASALLLVVIVVSLAYLFQSHTASPDSFLMGGDPVPAAQLPTMEAAFNKAGLRGYEIDGNRIRVPRGQQPLYMGALADEGALPPDFGKYLEKALANDGPWASTAKRHESLQIAKQSELQLILSRMKGVQSASVLYDEKKVGGLSQQMVCTASVNVQPAGSQPLDEECIRMIRISVASAFAGLMPESVSVTDLNGRTYPGKSGGRYGNAADNEYVQLKRAFEADWENKIRAQLMIPGVLVSTNVELIRDTEFEENKTILDPKSVIYKANESNSSKTSEGAAPAGRVGLAAQQPGGANQPGTLGASPTGPKMSEETNHIETATAVPTTTIRRKQQGLTPDRVKVAITIPTNYYEKVWKERNPTVAGQDPKKPELAAIAEIERQVKEDVKNSVVGLLPPIDPGTDPFPQVTVTSAQSLTTDPLPLPSVQDHALSWLAQYWTTLGLGGLALVSLLVLRSVVRSVPAPPSSTMTASETHAAGGLSLVAGGEVTTETEDAEEVSTPRGRLRRRTASGPSLREELTSMVKEDPDAAVAVLRNWIGAGA